MHVRVCMGEGLKNDCVRGNDSNERERVCEKGRGSERASMIEDKCVRQ